MLVPRNESDKREQIGKMKYGGLRGNWTVVFIKVNGPDRIWTSLRESKTLPVPEPWKLRQLFQQPVTYAMKKQVLNFPGYF